MRPLEQIASGRRTFARHAGVEGERRGGDESAGDRAKKKKSAAAQRTLVFDEIDTGIGGRAAEAVGKKLKALSKGNQVLCVTHLPQIATFADHHYVIEKREAAGRAKTTVRQISGRRTHGRSGAHAVRSEADRDFAETCRADDSGEWVGKTRRWHSLT